MKKQGLLLWMGILLVGCSQQELPLKSTPNTEVSQTQASSLSVIAVEGKTFEVTIADTHSKRQKGLMGVDTLEEGTGMLFIFDKPGIHKFWMKNTLIPLDIIWLDKDYKVVDKVTAPPCTKDPCPSYGPKSEAWFVLEVKGGSF